MMQHQLFSSMQCKRLMFQSLMERRSVFLEISCIYSQQALALEL